MSWPGWATSWARSGPRFLYLFVDVCSISEVEVAKCQVLLGGVIIKYDPTYSQGSGFIVLGEWAYHGLGSMVGDLSNLLLVSAAKRGSASPYSKPLVEARNGHQICRLKIDKSWNGTKWSACIPKGLHRLDSIAEVCRSQHLSTSDRHPQFSEVDLSPGFTVFSLFLVSFQVLKVSNYPHFPVGHTPPSPLLHRRFECTGGFSA